MFDAELFILLSCIKFHFRTRYYCSIFNILFKVSVVCIEQPCTAHQRKSENMLVIGF